ncbi:hypothetical protein ANN_25244 [Periplaneta americana]|uniref:Endonuclease-reverse transcriptase n=1 Tax=Periplaneta americana TaxID=6978 RepID=A0ABQ8S1C1_PERAM|nr:hypothetical protein ANN_25244 [Periplaneta americana]
MEVQLNLNKCTKREKWKKRQEKKLRNERKGSEKRLFNDTVSTTRLFYGIDDSEMVFGEMRPRIRHRLPEICLTVGSEKPNQLYYGLYGCKTWTLTLREEQRLRVFENKVLRKIFWAKRDEVTGEWRKLHKAELHALYSSADIIRNIKSRRLRWAGHVARMGESRNTHRVLVERPKGKGPLGRSRRRWEDNIKMDLREVGYDDRDWIHLSQDRDLWRAYVRAAMNLRVPKSYNACEMSPGSSTESYPAFARIGLRETPGRNLNQVTCPDRDSNSGHLVSRPDALTVTPQPVNRPADKIRNEAVLERVAEERMMLKLIKRRKSNWLGHWLRRNCLLKDALEGKVNGRRIRGRRRYQMIDDII